MSASKHTLRDVDALTSKTEEHSPSSGSLTSETSKKLNTFHYDGQLVCEIEAAKDYVLTDVRAIRRSGRRTMWGAAPV